MRRNKTLFSSLLCGVLCLLLIASLFSFPAAATTDSEIDPEENPSSTRVQAGYSFDDSADITAEIGGTYPLSTKEFGTGLVSSVSGLNRGGMKGYIHMDEALFHNLSQFSMGFRTRFSRSQAESKSTLFLAEGMKGESAEISFVTSNGGLALQLTVSDGAKTSRCVYNVSSVLTEEAQWIHIAFTYKVSGTVSRLTLYVNGKSSSTSVSASSADLSKMTCSTAAFHGIFLDDLYCTDYPLEANKISSLSNLPVGTFYASEAESMKENPSDTPDGPTVPVEKHDYTWAAYLFDGTFAAGTDYHSGDIPATVDNACTLIDTAKLISKYGYAAIRREASAPVSYLTLDSRLFRGQSYFTFACWVYRNGKTLKNQEVLLDLKGEGILRFAPYAGETDSSLSAYVEYTDTRGNVHRQTIKDGNPADPRNKWVHYGITVNESGEISVYVDGVEALTVSSSVNPATLAFSQCKVVTGSSSEDQTRTVVDEIYVTPKALSAAEMRKIHFYGIEQYTSRVLPDPGQSESGDQPENPYAPDAVDLAEDAYSKTASISKGFIGTTFDDRSNAGQDWNNSANASVTGGRLTQGISSYGLALDGSSFVRYPAEILNGAQSLTVSLSYSWEGAAEGERSQRLFDFSRKSSSVSDPSAFLFLEMGNGISGLRLGISDGISSTYLTCDYTAVNQWTRVTVTVSAGKIVLYINDAVAATGDTEVDVASIAPNFYYLGRSGIKGDPMFVGIIDEVYVSNQSLSPQEVPLFLNGISAALEGKSKASVDVWGIIFNCIIALAVILVLAVIAGIVVILVRKDKNTSEEDAPVPVPISMPESSEQAIVGPRSARRLAAADSVESGDATVKFRKVSTADSVESGDATVKFRKVSAADSVESGDATVKFRKISTSDLPVSGEMTAKFQKITDDSSKSDPRS
ncbi:MAG: hypothetical protein J6B54_01395 [Clostridia bacterium]|nr:hypothetical protein [Clostridia bacterium]